MAARQRSNGNGNGNGENAKLIAVLEERHKGLTLLIDNRFNSLEETIERRFVESDSARENLNKNVRTDIEKLEGRLWKLMAGAGGFAVIELVHLFLKR